ncbi:hypothetical protein ACIBHX_30325 [Nonomuraea sp. NPDC050536]|uniref:hypothetical protein n=1 Tax=Nonomuraea sp. NPDC050536 TaxID=3364366 RepID=UPI0037C7B742
MTLAAALAVGALLAAAGVAEASTYYGQVKACRGYTNPGAYPYGVRLNPCLDSIQSNGHWVWGGVEVLSPQTDIHIYSQTGWKYRGRDGNPWPGEPHWNGAVLDWGSQQGHYGPNYVVNQEYGQHVDPGHCYYSKIWFTESGHTYGPAESPGDCF